MSYETQDKRCGTCRWWEKIEEPRSFPDAFGKCHWPVPLAMTAAIPMFSFGNQANCPTWAATEEPTDD